MAAAADLEPEEEDTGVHHRRRFDLYQRAEKLLERAARLSSEPPPPPGVDDLSLAETLDLDPDPDSQHRVSVH